jgi:hypothetical protein
MNVNVKATVTEADPPTTYYLTTSANNLDNFYMKAKDKDNELVAYSTYNVTVQGTSYTCVAPKGGNAIDINTSEALAYYLNFYCELYMITRKAKKISATPYLTQIINVLNTITVLYTSNQSMSSPQFKNVMFPAWKYIYQNQTLQPNDSNSYASATDANLEILKSLMKLYIFNYNNDKNLTNLNQNGTTISIAPLESTFLGIQITKNDYVDVVLKKIIISMIYNLMFGTSSNNGHFSFVDNTVNFCPYCSNPTESVTSNTNTITQYLDYINFSCFIYLYHFFKIIGINPAQPENYSIYDTILEDGVSKTIHFPTWSNINTSLKNYINYINTNLTSSSFSSNLYPSGDGFSSTINRLSYQIIYLYILLSRGDRRLILSITDCTDAWNINTTISIDIITTICKNFINYEISKDALKLVKTSKSGYITINPQGIIQYPYIVDTWNGNDQSVAENFSWGFFRQLSYMCVKSILNDTSWPPKNRGQDAGNYTYFENHNFEYFGFSNYSPIIPYSFQDILSGYDYINNKVCDIKQFGQSYKPGDWVEGCDSWNGGTDPYFALSICSLHQLNYYLYLGV